MLRIPTSGDTPPPLLVPLRKIVVEEPAAGENSGKKKTRHRGKKQAVSATHSWEKRTELLPKVTHAKSQRRQMLIFGAALFALIVAGVIVSMTMGHKPVSRPVADTNSAPVVEKPDRKTNQEAVGRSEASYLTEIEPLTRKFLDATTVEEILPIIRHPEVTEARIRNFYPDGKIEPPGISQFSTTGGLAMREKLLVVTVRTRAQEEKKLAFIETPQGLKIDWESWVGWSSISWEKFLATKPVTGHVFRVTLAPVEYYNFGFSDEEKWQSYRMESTDGEHAVYGYVERSSVLDKRIRPAPEVTYVDVMLSLKFPEGSTSNNQVIIDGFVCDGWVEVDQSP
jgi:hypothetical protein